MKATFWAILVAALCVGHSAQAQERNFDLPAADAVRAIPEFARQAGVQIVAPADELKGITTPALRGAFDTRAALKRLLVGTGLEIASDDGAVIILRRIAKEQTMGNPSPSSGGPSALGEPLSEIVVTGTHIRGMTPAAPIIEVTSADIKASGHADLGSVIRDIPQNFGGGQNPGIGPNAFIGNSENQNVGGASSINLRGLGPDATLTLLNGRRLSYDSFVQAVDISSIPIEAVDRIQIVADGASAVYGSDAVAGVANIILKRDYDGLAASARVGRATEGGDFDRRYGVVGGSTWGDGGFIVAYNFSQNDAIDSDDRDYTNSLPRPNTLYPEMRSHNAVLSVHQDLNSIVTLSTDALYSKRWMRSFNTDFSTTARSTVTENFDVAPSLKVHLPLTWSLELTGTFGRDRAATHDVYFDRIGAVGLVDGDVTGCYCNSSSGMGVDAEGALFDLKAGAVRLAVGAGYRDAGFKSNFSNQSAVIDADRKNYFAYSELFLPVVSVNQNFNVVRSLNFTAALRYEHYSDFGEETTPKLGFVLDFARDFSLKGSWGKSFKAPTLSQEYAPVTNLLAPARLLSPTFPSTATVLATSGGNLDLSPETAKTWSTTATFKPDGVKGLDAELSYFNVDYSNRVMQPYGSLITAYGNPAYQQFIIGHPSASQLQQAIAASSSPILNISGTPYGPANVAVLGYDVYANIARQRIHGIDLSTTYATDMSSGRLTLSGSGAWLSISQQTAPALPATVVTGTIFNPAHFRGFLGATWDGSPVTLSTRVNYTGGVRNLLITPAADGHAMTTVDLAGIYHTPAGSQPWENIDLLLSMQNAFDSKPPYLQSTTPYYPSYDSTNYSAIGRFITFEIAKRFH